MKRQGYFRLTEIAAKHLAKRYNTPLLLLSLDQVEKNYRFFQENLPGVKIYYAMKANPDIAILNRLASLGSCFDVASDGEIRTLAELGVGGSRMIYANPIKNHWGFEACEEMGVNKFTFDSFSEIGKMAEASPGATVLLRVRIDNSGAKVDLNKKFGAPRDKVIEMLKTAQKAGLDVAGLCFHVGSQVTNTENYLLALEVMRELYAEAAAAGINLRIMDIGGGFPIYEPGMIEFNSCIMFAAIHEVLERDFAGIEIWAEPGRFICGTAVNLLTKVIGINERDGQTWYFLDDGLYGTFSGVIFDQWNYRLLSFREGEQIEATFAGPSCDSLDILFKGKLTVPLEMNEVLLVPDCGAYTSASSTTFNGFPRTRRLVWEEVSKSLPADARQPYQG